MNAPATLGWMEGGERFFATVLTDHLEGPNLNQSSLLPGWSRRSIVAHVARNADALVNLLAWARTGTETPMYASPEARDAAITETAKLPAQELVADCCAAGQRLSTAVRQMPETAWHAEVRTAQGRTVPAAEVCWMRCREVWVHAVDLNGSAGFGDIPDDVLTALIDDVTGAWQRRGQTPQVRFTTGRQAWGTGPVTVTGDLPALAAYVTGRHGLDGLSTNGALQSPPPWL